MPKSKVHYIYHIIGRKVGCTENIATRKLLYKRREHVVPDIEILEVLHDKTDQEAGDIEWKWADKFGYERSHHYSISIVGGRNGGREGGLRSMANRTPEQRSELGKKANNSMSPKQRSENARNAGLIGSRRRLESTTQEQRSNWGKQKGGMSITAECPHCGKVGQYMIMHRWHFDNCPHKS